MIHSQRRAARGRRHTVSALLISTILGGAHSAFAQQVAASDPNSNAVGEIIVTSQKRAENLQDVPISVQAIGAAKIEQLNIDNFADFAKFLPGVSFETFQPGQTTIFMRGINSGGVVNHSGPEPTAGLYLDEIPVTTIGGMLDVHIYDVSRIEQLSGPQGTLYGASSETGNIRIITNQPDPSGFSASYDLEGSQTKHGGLGEVVEGYVNIPLTDHMAVRLVGWQDHETGFIDNVPGSLTFSTGITINNSNVTKSQYNYTDIWGGRAALKIDLNDEWTVTPSFMTQDLNANGITGFNPAVGDLDVRHFSPDTDHDQFYLFGLTVTGKFRDFDITYAGGGLIRDITSQLDYTDYSYAYDKAYGSAAFFTDNSGNFINPSQEILGRDHFTKQSHELRISSPSTDRFRVTTGLFIERQEHIIAQDYFVPGLATASSVTGWPSTYWLTDQLRVDRDYAWFSEASYDITPDLTATGGVRVFKSDNSLSGFYGFGATNPAGFGTGQSECFSPVQYNGGPCTDLDKEVKEINATYKANLTYKLDADRMIYVTASSGYRPGGVNRNGNLPPYQSDMLYNYEFGWKTTWFGDHSLRWNGDIYYDNWNNVQFSYLGANSLTVIENAGSAISRGLETDLTYRVTPQFTINGSFNLTDAELSTPLCLVTTSSCSVSVESSTAPANPILAPSGRQLPLPPI